ncbi:hypothetical protein Patl1_03406 [Pistacia atlantica]|uniref:Uncharacterized protein n=1 Tax=Pistacia atlantica TaxID=434234 RepID=A0ACC1C929_9ROSI|nr:hypothetical protein Patl1_03406 [Pistacia atlantica]
MGKTSKLVKMQTEKPKTIVVRRSRANCRTSSARMPETTTKLKVYKPTCEELKDDDNSHYSPHGVLSNLLVQRIKEIEKRNQNKSNTNFDTMNQFFRIMFIFLFPKEGNYKQKRFSKPLLLFGNRSNSLSIRNSYHS